MDRRVKPGGDDFIYLPSKPRMPLPRRVGRLRIGSLPPLSAATNLRPTARGMPSVVRPAAAAYMARAVSRKRAACGCSLARQRRRRCRAGGVDHRRSRHLVRMALARDLQVEELELLL